MEVEAVAVGEAEEAECAGAGAEAVAAGGAGAVAAGEEVGAVATGWAEAGPYELHYEVLLGVDPEDPEAASRLQLLVAAGLGFSHYLTHSLGSMVRGSW